MKLGAFRVSTLGSLLVCLLAAGCGGGGETESQRLSQVRIENIGDVEVGFNVAINGRAFFSNDEAIIKEVRQDAKVNSETSPEMALWRLLVATHVNFHPYTAELWGHSPTLLLNSIGFSLCDDVAAAFYALAQQAGLESRIWDLAGHVVPEVKVNGRWEMLDPDLATYYLASDSQIAGVEELAANPRLITHPIKPSADSFANSEFVADIYASRENNFVNLWLQIQVPIPEVARPFQLPPGGVLEFPILDEPPVRSYNGYEIPQQALMRIVLPPGWAGELKLPFVIREVRGIGKMAIGDRSFEIGGRDAEAALDDRTTAASNQVRIASSTSAIEVIFMVNPIRFALNDMRQVEIRDSDAKTLVLSTL